MRYSSYTSWDNGNGTACWNDRSVTSGKETVIFVKGRENYISTVNKNINNWIKNNGVKIVDCYDVNEVGGKVSNIVKNYKKILSTSGVEKML